MGRTMKYMEVYNGDGDLCKPPCSLRAGTWELGTLNPKPR